MIGVCPLSHALSPVDAQGDHVWPWQPHVEHVILLSSSLTPAVGAGCKGQMWLRKKASLPPARRGWLAFLRGVLPVCGLPDGVTGSPLGSGLGNAARRSRPCFPFLVEDDVLVFVEALGSALCCSTVRCFCRGRWCRFLPSRHRQPANTARQPGP